MFRTVLRIGLVLLFLAIAVGGQTLSIVHAQSGGTYYWDNYFETAWDTWYPCSSSSTCTFTCDAAHVGMTCQAQTCEPTYVTARDGSSGNMLVDSYRCTYQAPACAANYGATCSSPANACGVTTNGTIQCDGTCSVTTAPAVVDACPSDAGTQCSTSQCSPTCAANQGASCTSAANSCSMTNSGTIQCDGTCSATAPPDSSCPTYAQSTYYAQSAYTPYAQSTYYAQSSYYSQSSYYAQGSYAPASTCGTGITPTIAAAPMLVKSGETTTLSWSATGVPAGTTCTITGANVGGAGVNSVSTSAADSTCTVASGSRVATVTGQTVYTITCSGMGKSVIVNIVPVIKEF